MAQPAKTFVPPPAPTVTTAAVASAPRPRPVLDYRNEDFAPVTTGIAWSLLIPAAALVGYAMDLRAGTYEPTGVLCIAIALGLGVAAIALAAWRGMQRYIPAAQLALLGMCVAAHFALHLRATPVPNLHLPADMPQPRTAQEFVETFLMFLQQYYSGVGLAAVCAGAVLTFGQSFLGKATFPVLIVIWLGLGTWVLKNTQPQIDVFVFQQDGSAALLKGTNPYTITFKDPYNSRSPWYGPGLSVNGVLQFGYPYMPLTLLMTLPGYIATGDSRYSQLLAMALAALLIGYSRRTPISFGAAVLYLFLSRTMLVLEEAWTEPLVVLLLAAVLFCAVRFPKITPYVLGLFLVSKQYVPLCAPLVLLLCKWPLRPRQVLDVLWRAAAAGAIVTIPLVLWNFGAFWHSAVDVQKIAPFRPDSLSFLAWVHGPPMPGAPPLVDPPSAILAFIVLGVMLVLCLWLAPRTISGFCGAVAVTYLAFFFFNKQAFANYYFFTAGALCCAIAAGSMPDVEREKASAPVPRA